MFARLLATFCLFNLAVVSAEAADVVVYLRSESSQPSRPIEIMKQELGPLLGPTGYRLEWGGKERTASSLVVLELRGTCAMPAGNARPDGADLKEMASSAASGESVLPFSWINCAALTRMLAPALANEAPARRDYLYGRAMARLVAHELYHILANTRDHEREGLAKPRFTLADLTTEVIEFDRSALAKLDGDLETGAVVTSDGGTGR